LETEGNVIAQLASKAGKSIGEIEVLIAEKKKKFSGLLTDSGAAFMVAKDLGIETGTDSIKRIDIAAMRDGMQNFDLLARVMQVFSPKDFEKNGRKGKLCTLIIADSTGETRLTLWHDDVEKLRKAGIGRGSVLLLHNCYAKEFNGKVQASLAYNGSFETGQETMFAGLPKAQGMPVKIGSLAEGMNDIIVSARVLRVFPTTEFDKKGRKGKLVNFVVGDETGSARATAWNGLAEQAAALGENDIVEIEGAYTKQGLKGIELHLGWQARIETRPLQEKELPSAEEMRVNSAERKNVSGLAAGDQNALVEGEITSVNRGMLLYAVCPKCHGKIQRLDEGIICDKCGEVKEPEYRAVVSVKISDGSGEISVVAYGKEAEKIIGLGAKEIEKQRSERGAEAMVEELQALRGTKIKAVGKARKSAYSGELEFVAGYVEMK
jgi:replication factor A1